MAVGMDDGPGGAWFVKFRNVGDTLVGAIASDPRKSQRQKRKFKKSELLYKENGKPLLEEILHLVAMPGSTVFTGTEDDGYAPVEEMQHVRYSLSGFKWGQVIQAREELPAANGFRVGQSVSSDVYTIRLVGWSAETANPQAAREAGFTLNPEGKRILLRSQEDKNKYVVAQSQRGGNTNPAKDFEIAVRRIKPEEKAFEQAADEWYASRPWEFKGADGDSKNSGGSGAGSPNPFAPATKSPSATPGVAGGVDPWNIQTPVATPPAQSRPDGSEPIPF